LASSFLKDENLRAEAEIACFNVIDRVRWSQPDEAIKVLNKILENPTSIEIKNQANNLIKDIG